MRSEAQLFGEYCGLTCIGGSENKKCQCTGPAQCELRSDPRFSVWRFRAQNNMRRTLLNILQTKGDG